MAGEIVGGAALEDHHRLMGILKKDHKRRARLDTSIHIQHSSHHPIHRIIVVQSLIKQTS